MAACLLISSGTATAALLSSASRRQAIAGGILAGTSRHSAAAAPPPGSVGARVEELKTLGQRVEQSGKLEVPEFWPGRLEGRPAPTPKVILASAPPIVILPGFGNDQEDYMTPNGLPEEVGLQAALARRGAASVVVPIRRPMWLNVAKGLSDVGFLTGNAQPEGPAFSWYVESARATVQAAVEARAAAGGADSRCVLVGHSAGGWLARALCVVQGDEWVKRHVRGIVTLGAPHGSPPPDVPDQTRGTIPNVNRRAPGAYYAASGIFYVCVSSGRVVGDEGGDASARNAFTAYNLVLGRGQGVQGDGFVPIEAAFLEGALPCEFEGKGAFSEGDRLPSKKARFPVRRPLGLR